MEPPPQRYCWSERLADIMRELVSIIARRPLSTELPIHLTYPLTGDTTDLWKTVSNIERSGQWEWFFSSPLPEKQVSVQVETVDMHCITEWLGSFQTTALDWEWESCKTNLQNTVHCWTLKEVLWEWWRSISDSSQLDRIHFLSVSELLWIKV